MNTQIVSYSWQVPGRTLIEVDEALGNVAIWQLQDNGQLVRTNHKGGKSLIDLLPDGSSVEYSSSGTQRQTVTRLGPVVAFRFEYKLDDKWIRVEEYDWFSWPLTSAQLAESRMALRNSNNLAVTSMELLEKFRGSTVVGLSEKRLEKHNQALAVQQSRPGGQTAEPRATTVEKPRQLKDSARLALIVGISDYGDIGDLPNPVNDARAMAAKLEALGFVVNLVMDADQRTLRRAIQSFGEKLHGAGSNATGLFFYAGHGMQSQGKNYLIPSGAIIRREADLELEAVPADGVLAQMEAAKGSTNIIILDACRNTPIARSFRSGGQGLAQVQAPNGTFIAYSTAPGSVAADGAGPHSRFAQGLLNEIGNPNLSIEAVFRNVRKSVLEATEGEQTPWDSSSLTEEFRFAI